MKELKQTRWFLVSSRLMSFMAIFSLVFASPALVAGSKDNPTLVDTTPITEITPLDIKTRWKAYQSNIQAKSYRTTLAMCEEYRFKFFKGPRPGQKGSTISWTERKSTFFSFIKDTVGNGFSRIVGFRSDVNKRLNNKISLEEHQKNIETPTDAERKALADPDGHIYHPVVVAQSRLERLARIRGLDDPDSKLNHKFNHPELLNFAEKHQLDVLPLSWWILLDSQGYQKAIKECFETDQEIEKFKAFYRRYLTSIDVLASLAVWIVPSVWVEKGIIKGATKVTQGARRITKKNILGTRRSQWLTGLGVVAGALGLSVLAGKLSVDKEFEGLRVLDRFIDRVGSNLRYISGEESPYYSIQSLINRVQKGETLTHKEFEEVFNQIVLSIQGEEQFGVYSPAEILEMQNDAAFIEEILADAGQAHWQYSAFDFTNIDFKKHRQLCKGKIYGTYIKTTKDKGEEEVVVTLEDTPCSEFISLLLAYRDYWAQPFWKAYDQWKQVDPKKAASWLDRITTAANEDEEKLQEELEILETKRFIENRKQAKIKLDNDLAEIYKRDAERKRKRAAQGE